ncbi:LSM8 homolog, U6 small nuclear RNA associated isoform X2 [Bos mutus]|uniref:LSM8 homolog, U6 small nuclear RNA associated isoform X2 n=1 Tax=Bos mutus TaxID=72004 RepID=UPI0038B483BC
MTSALENYINRTVAVITSDGRMIVGTLKGFDQTINLILDESHERVFSSSQGVEQVVLGLYIVRGDNVESKARSSMKKFEDREDMKYSRKVPYDCSSDEPTSLVSLLPQEVDLSCQDIYGFIAEEYASFNGFTMCCPRFLVPDCQKSN